MTQHDVAIREKSELAMTDAKPFSSAIIVSQENIAQTRQSLALLRQMVKDVLVTGIDYGQIPGVPEEFLWDPGASQITAAFNCRFGSPRVISQTMNETLIAVVIDQPIISLQTGQEVTSCVGAASTSEVKHKYRWVYENDLADWGYVDAAIIKTLKTKKDKGGTPYQWRIANPEPGELLNTIWKIAAKRGRVGAAQLLPGVSSALREKFAAAKADKKGGGKKQEPSTDWDVFWSKTKQMGLESDQVHKMLNVKSIKEWVETGMTLDQAVEKLADELGKGNKQSAAGTTANAEKSAGSEKTLKKKPPEPEDKPAEKTAVPDFSEGSINWINEKLILLNVNIEKVIQEVFVKKYGIETDTVDLGSNLLKLSKENLADFTSLLNAKEIQINEAKKKGNTL